MKEVTVKISAWVDNCRGYKEVKGFAFYWLGRLWVVHKDILDTFWEISDYETGVKIDKISALDRDRTVKQFKEAALERAKDKDIDYRTILEYRIGTGDFQRVNSYTQEFFEELKSLCEPEGVIP